MKLTNYISDIASGYEYNICFTFNIKTEPRYKIHLTNMKILYFTV